MFADVDMLRDPDGASLTETMATTRWSHTRLRVILVTMLGRDHPTVLYMRDINTNLLETETELEG